MRVLEFCQICGVTTGQLPLGAHLCYGPHPITATCDLCYAALRYPGEPHNCPTIPSVAQCHACQHWITFPDDWPHDCMNEIPELISEDSEEEDSEGVPSYNWSDDDDNVFLAEDPWSVSPNIGSDESDSEEGLASDDESWEPAPFSTTSNQEDMLTSYLYELPPPQLTLSLQFPDSDEVNHILQTLQTVQSNLPPPTQTGEIPQFEDWLDDLLDQ